MDFFVFSEENKVQNSLTTENIKNSKKYSKTVLEDASTRNSLKSHAG